MNALGLFIGWPETALLPAGVFLFLYSRYRQRGALVAALAWLTYYPYERAMELRILCSGECNIRVDLLLLYPLLAGLSLWAIYTFIRTSHTPKRPDHTS